MKKIALLLLAILITLNLQAQRKINLDTLNIDQLDLFKEKAVKLRNTGMALTLAGIMVFAVFEGLAINVLLNHSQPSQPSVINVQQKAKRMSFCIARFVHAQRNG